MEFKFAEAGDLDQIKQLLADCELPYEDVTSAHLSHFLVLRDNGIVAGSVGLEVLGDIALLRSLAIDRRCRGQGWGSQLTERIEAYAREQGITALYLLTTTADAFFGRHAYVRTDRTTAPTPLHSTTEFSSLCPDRAVCMMKHL